MTGFPARRLLSLTALLLALPLPAARAGEPVWGPWSVLGPFDHHGGGRGVGRPGPGEEELLERVGHGGPGPDLEEVRAGKDDRELAWRPADVPGDPAAADAGVVDLNANLRGETPEVENALAYLHRTVTVDEPLSLPLAFGSDDAARLWLNGESIATVDRARALDATGDSATLELLPGTNHLLVKVLNAGGGWSFAMSPVRAYEVAAPHELQRAVDEAVERGVRWLVEGQERDGSWDYDTLRYPHGQTALALYTLLHCGATPEHQAVRRATEHLLSRPVPTKTYSLGCELLALGALRELAELPRSDAGPGSALDDDTVDRIDDRIEEGVDLLLDGRDDLWGYPGSFDDPGDLGHEDLSNTQYAVLGLRAAARAGARVPRRVWQQLADEVTSHQTPGGGFVYLLGHRPTTSMTAAGVAVIDICLERLRAENALSPQLETRADEAARDGLRALERAFPRELRAQGESPSGRWWWYELYGVERVAALRELERLGDCDWYGEGATHLIATQKADGSWADGEKAPNTCFALLFLARATARSASSGAAAQSAAKTYATPADEGLQLRAAGDTPLALWVSGLGPRASGGATRVLRVEYLAGERSLGVVEGDADAPWAGERFALQHRFEVPGGHRVRAVATVVLPGGAPVELESPELEVRIENTVDERLLACARPYEDQLELAGTGVETSSRRDAGSVGENAIDGLPSTAWICAPDDPQPTLSLDLRRGLRSSAVVLSQVGGTLRTRDLFDPIHKVELFVNKGRESFVVELDPDPLYPTRVELPRGTRVLRLEVRVLERGRGAGRPGEAGFAEVRLLR